MSSPLTSLVFALLALVTGPVLASPSVSPSDSQKQELASVGLKTYTANSYKPGKIRHIVLFKYTDSTTAAQKEEVKQRFMALQQRCMRKGRSYIVSIEAGNQISGEGADLGLEQGFIVTFLSEGDRNYYVGQPIITDPKYYDPAHQAFKEFVGPLLAKTNGALVFDFYVGR